MPIYEYRCESCGERFEELVSAAAKNGPPCPSCGTKKPKRLYSTFATEWVPSNVSWHNMPGKHDMGGAELSRPSTSIPKAIPGAGAKKKDKGKKKKS